MGLIITTNLLAYACGQIINGLMTDRMAASAAMMIGAAGTVAMNLAFGAASFMACWMFVALWGLNGTSSVWRAGMVKIHRMVPAPGSAGVSRGSSGS
jgi:OPA family glycerol-3-phosphate transporter-like MFS transporter